MVLVYCRTEEHLECVVCIEINFFDNTPVLFKQISQIVSEYIRNPFIVNIGAPETVARFCIVVVTWKHHFESKR